MHKVAGLAGMLERIVVAQRGRQENVMLSPADRRIKHPYHGLAMTEEFVTLPMYCFRDWELVELCRVCNVLFEQF